MTKELLKFNNKKVRKPSVFLTHYRFSIQWHITARCDQHCKHCYMYDSAFYKNELENELDIDQCKTIIDNLAQTVERWGVPGFIAITGGDPLLCNHLFPMLGYIKKYPSLACGMMGNSYHINEETATRLKQYDIKFYQISLDGLEKTHDFLRSPGAFQDTIRAYRVLKKFKLSPCCMSTVSRINAGEICDLIKFLAKKKLITTFDFDRLVPIGSGADLTDMTLTAEEYHQLLLKINETYSEVMASGYQIKLGRKDNLWHLILQEMDELGKTPKLPEACDVYSGCLIGWYGLSVLADGTVLACRRLPVKIGKLPEQSISDIFIKSQKLNEMRDDSKIEKCGICSLRSRCRGCRAVAYAMSGGNYFAKDRFCWK